MPSSKILGYLKIDKKFAVLAAWIELEQKLKRLAEYELEDYRSNKFEFIRPSDYRRLNLPKPVIQAIGELRNARNRIAHEAEPDISESEILRYLDLAADIENYVKKKLDLKGY